MVVIRIGKRIVHVNNRLRQNDSTGNLGDVRAHRIQAAHYFDRLRQRVMIGNEMQLLAVEPENVGKQAVAEGNRISRDGIEHRLDIGRRAANHAQNFARRSLLLQSFSEITVALL